MKIKVGEYVRIDGYIGKLVEYIPNALNYLKIDIGREIKHCDDSIDNFIYTRYGFQLKHSENILDLIEEGDYVNGYLINYIPDNEKAVYHDASDCVDVEKFENKDIKTIVTKQQFAEMEYKI